jgi:hypothetical protein
MLVCAHVDASTAERHALRLETKTLLDRRISAQLDFPSRADDAVPGQPEG